MNDQSTIFAEVLEEEALRQYESAMKLDCVVQGALMPDAHTGYSLPIGAVIKTKGMIFPSWIGYDIGCGVCACKTRFKRENIEPHRDDIFKSIYRSVPTGFNKHKKPQKWTEDVSYHATDTCQEIIEKDRLKSLGTLGGGNHFIEISYDENDNVWVVIHSGSRGIGHAVASHYMRLASGGKKALEGHYGFDINSEDGKNYIMDIDFCLKFALENRKQIGIAVVSEMMNILSDKKLYPVPVTEFINRNHNHADIKDGFVIHRKGATHAEDGMMGVIPGNMRDGSFIVKGKGNEKSLCSSSHGAGRVMSRTKAKKEIDLADFEKEMEGITAKVYKSTIDESPFAYKNIFEVMELQKDLVEVKHHLKPIINIKA